MNEAELKAKMDELGRAMYEMENKQLEFDYSVRELSQKIDDLKAELKPVFLERKLSLESDTMKAQYRKGAVKWDTKWLDGYSVDHPEIEKYRRVGQPTVAFVLRSDAWEND